MEIALHEWLLDSPLRTLDPKEARLAGVRVRVGVGVRVRTLP